MDKQRTEAATLSRASYRWRKTAILALAALFLTISVDAGADSMRCGRKVVRTGDSSNLLLELCGKPRSTASARETIRISGGTREVQVKQWYYRKSSRSLPQLISIYQGRIVAIKKG